jgi:soluble lytic murein transglycosylase-like protein
VSTQSVTGVLPGELALEQRVAQLQALIESAREVAAGMPLRGSTSAADAEGAATGAAAAGYSAAGSGTDFASALQAATSSDTLGASDPSGVVGSSSLPSYAQGGEGEADQYEALINQAAARNGLDPAVLHGLIQQESGFDPNATSGAGAAGLTQLMPGTASSLGVANPMNPAESIEGGARYLGEMMSRFAGNSADALAAYNAGPGAVEQYGGVPPYAETESYVSKVLGYAETYSQSHPTTTGALL